MYNRVILIGHVAVEPTRGTDSADLYFFQVDAGNERVMIMANTFPDQVRPIHPEDVNLNTDDEVLVEGKLAARHLHRGDDGHVDIEHVTYVVEADRIARLRSPSVTFRRIGGRAAHRSVRVDGQPWGEAEFLGTEGWSFHTPTAAGALGLAGRTFASRDQIVNAVREVLDNHKTLQLSNMQSP